MVLTKLVWGISSLLITLHFFIGSSKALKSFENKYKTCKSKGFISFSGLFLVLILSWTYLLVSKLLKLPACSKGFAEIDELIWLIVLLGSCIACYSIQIEAMGVILA